MSEVLAYLKHGKRLVEMFPELRNIEGESKMVSINHATCKKCGTPTFVGEENMYFFGLCKECFQSSLGKVKTNGN